MRTIMLKKVAKVTSQAKLVHLILSPVFASFIGFGNESIGGSKSERESFLMNTPNWFLDVLKASVPCW